MLNRLLLDSRVVARGLPRTLFPSGRLYFNEDAMGRVTGRWFGPEHRRKAVVVHNNFKSGHDEKALRFQRAGLWLADYHLVVHGNEVVARVEIGKEGRLLTGLAAGSEANASYGDLLKQYRDRYEAAPY